MTAPGPDAASEAYAAHFLDTGALPPGMHSGQARSRAEQGAMRVLRERVSQEGLPPRLPECSPSSPADTPSTCPPASGSGQLRSEASPAELQALVFDVRRTLYRLHSKRER